MERTLPIRSALISVFSKDGLEPLALELARHGVELYSTGGTQSFLEGLGLKVNRVEDLTSYPSILGGRVKTLHPKVFGGILSRRDEAGDIAQLEEYDIPPIDLVIVDLYPFEDTVAAGASEADIIEKIDIGGISLIRAAAKNHRDVVIIPSKAEYWPLVQMLKQGNTTTLAQRREFAKAAFAVTAHYDTAIGQWFSNNSGFSHSTGPTKALRYGENPHQRGWFHGDINAMFEQLHGKELSYNNLLDIDAAVNLIDEFSGTTFGILKHNNACGLATRPTLKEAYLAALAGDPVSAFGGVLICNRNMDVATAEEVDKLFCEVVIAPSYDAAALETLKRKKNRVMLLRKATEVPQRQFRTLLNGVIEQDRDTSMEDRDRMTTVTHRNSTLTELTDLEFANRLVKHTKSNTIVLAKNGQLLASGCGMTSRVDALRFAIQKARSFNFDLHGAVMASDAFFPFPDCVEIAEKEGILAVVQPGGSVKDQESIEYCNAHGMTMVTTGVRHFKH